MKHLLALCFVLVLSQTATPAQSADWWVGRGRDFLAARELTNANNCFAAAVTNAPNHPTANAFYAATRLLTLADQPAGKAFLDRLGFAATNRSVYDWTADVGRDTNGVFLAPTNMSASAISAFLRTNILIEMAGSASNLARITDTNFTLALSSNETTTVAVTLDYGDLLLLRAGLEAAQYAGYTIHSWNLDVQLTTLSSLLTAEATSAQSFLAQYPNLFTFDTTNDLSLAKQAFSNAATLYLRASDFIRNRPTNVTRLFNYDPGMASSESKFRSTLADLNRSLSGPVALTGLTNLTVDLGRHFTGASSPRSFFPQVAGNAIVAGTLPDPSFGGMVHGVPPYEIEGFLGHGDPHAWPPTTLIPFVSKFRAPERLPDGRVQVTLDALNDTPFLVQASTNLHTWTPVAAGTVQAGVLSFTDTAAAGASLQFYRALDASGAFLANGTVFDVTTGNPAPNALVVVWFLYDQPVSSLTNYTDAAGNYFFIDWRPPAYRTYVVNVSLPGLSPAEFVSYYYRDIYSGHSIAPVLCLAPLDYHPPNDNFSQRIALSGTNVTTTGFNVAATSEPGEPYTWSGQSVWWCWTAPANGAMTIDTSGSSFNAMATVYTGNSVSNLTQIANSYYDTGFQNGGVDFFVEAGTTYQIAVDSTSSETSGRIVLNLRSTPPRVPTITYLSQSQAVWTGDSASFYAGVTGTIPLTCQWRKDGVSLAGANLQYYNISNAQTNQAGAYSLVVTNPAGSVTSAVMILTVNWAPAPPNDMFANRLPITSLPRTVTGSNAGASKEPGEPYHGGYAGGKSVWWTWTAPSNLVVTVDTTGSSFENVFVVYTGDSLANLAAVATGYGLPGYTGGGIDFFATAGTAYQIAVDKTWGGSGSILLNMRSTALPEKVLDLAGGFDGTNVFLRFSGLPARSYRVQFTPKLSPPAWQTLGSVTAGSDGLFQFTDTNGWRQTQRFYRMVWP